MSQNGGKKLGILHWSKVSIETGWDAFVEIDLQSHEKHAWRKLLWPFSQNLIFLPYNTHRDTHKQVFHRDHEKFH